MLPRTGSIAKAAACADAARAIFDAAPEHQLLDVLQSAPVIDLRAQFLRHLRSVPAKGVRFYPDGLVALTYRYQQVSMNAHPADFGASCPRTARFVLEYRDRDLRFAPLDGACTTRLSFGSVRRLQRRVVDEPEADTCTQQDRSYVHANAHSSRRPRTQSAAVPPAPTQATVSTSFATIRISTAATGRLLLKKS